MHENIFATYTVEHLPEPTSDPALALARAAHLVFEVSRLSRVTSDSHMNEWAADVARAQMRILDPKWTDCLDGLAGASLMSRYPIQRFRAECDALGEAGRTGYRELLRETFERLESLAEKGHDFLAFGPGARLAAMVATVPLPIFCHEWRDALVKIAFRGDHGPHHDFRFNIASVEFQVMDALWVKPDVVISRTLLGTQDLHEWIRTGVLEVRMDGRTKTVCLGKVCALTGAQWLLPGDRLREPDKTSLRNGRLVFSALGPPAILDRERGVVRSPASSIDDGAQVVGYAIWASRTAPYDPEVKFKSESWGQKQAKCLVDVRPLLQETLKDPAGNPVLYRSLAEVVRRPNVTAPATSTTSTAART